MISSRPVLVSAIDICFKGAHQAFVQRNPTLGLKLLKSCGVATEVVNQVSFIDRMKTAAEMNLTAFDSQCKRDLDTADRVYGAALDISPELGKTLSQTKVDTTHSELQKKAWGHFDQHFISQDTPFAIAAYNINQVWIHTICATMCAPALTEQCCDMRERALFFVALSTTEPSLFKHYLPNAIAAKLLRPGLLTDGVEKRIDWHTDKLAPFVLNPLLMTLAENLSRELKKPKEDRLPLDPTLQFLKEYESMRT